MNVNSGAPRTGMDIQDLRTSFGLGISAEELADFPCRDIEEVEGDVAAATKQVEFALFMHDG